MTVPVTRKLKSKVHAKDVAIKKPRKPKVKPQQYYEVTRWVYSGIGSAFRDEKAVFLSTKVNPRTRTRGLMKFIALLVAPQCVDTIAQAKAMIGTTQYMYYGDIKLIGTDISIPELLYNKMYVQDISK